MRNRVNEEVFNGRCHLMNSVERDVRTFQPILELGDAFGCIVRYHVNAVASKNEAGDSITLGKGFAQRARISRRYRQHRLAELGFQIGRRIAEEEFSLMKQSHSMAALSLIQVGG